MGADMHFNPPQDDLPTQVAHLVRYNRELVEENRRLREEVRSLRAKVDSLMLIIAKEFLHGVKE